MTPSMVSDTGAKVSMTSKEWVIPPRPKPGRKPATDTPPTKRKAQNRAAQRAFRERRAARVGELEELLDQQKDTHDKEESDLKTKIYDLEMEVQSFRSRCLLLESMLEKERQERIHAENRAESLRREQGRYGTEYGQPSWYDQERRRSSTHNQMRRTQKHVSTSSKISDNPADPSLTCGNCSVDGPCACADEALASVQPSPPRLPQDQDLKRPPSPNLISTSPKRYRSSEPEHKASLEILDSMEPASKEKCGFCEDGTYCVCADTENVAISNPTSTQEVLPPLIQQQLQTPPPSGSDVPPPLAMEMTADGAVKLPKRKHVSVPKKATTSTFSPGCGPNGPGSCAQCQADPKSGLFCRMMAAQLDRAGGSSGGGGCCGGKGAGGGCCKSKTSSTPVSGMSTSPKKITLPSLPSLGLSCAEAYKTLSSHKNFEKAAGDMDSWLPKLKATPVVRDAKGKGETMQPGRRPVEFEAASIMSVLKDFDVRFGREA